MRDKLWYMVLVLGCVAAVFGGALAFVNAHTRDVIEERTFRETVLPTLENVFAPYRPTNDFLKDKKSERVGEDAMGRQIRADIYVAQKNKMPLAMATILDGRGYGGIIRVMVAVDVNKKEIIATRTLQQTETRGLGDQIANPEEPFVKQFNGMRMEANLKLTSEGGQVDGMSGATVTSTAYAKTVKAACHLLLNQISQKGAP
ncbi:MAG: RnfABCDGE type electron transport complex subunit G [Deltaproteobacteria bacterium]|nr:RnfABCDGE type electron transport complex subunit G [Deltaproteobacteria bacterium]